MTDLLEKMFETSNFSPHGFCLFWEPDLLAVTIISQAAIALAYVAIPAQLLWATRSVRPKWMVVLFAAFILLCGLSHAIDILTLFRPYYWLSAVEALLTAFVSVATAALLPVAVKQWLRAAPPTVGAE